MINLFKYLTIFLAFIGSAYAKLKESPKKARDIVKYLNKLIILKTSPV